MQKIKRRDGNREANSHGDIVRVVDRPESVFGTKCTTRMNINTT